MPSDDYGINILFDLTTYKVFIQLDENYQIDFAGSGNFHVLLGLEKKLLKTSAFGANLPNISNSIDNIYLICSLLSDSIVSGKKSNVLFTFPTNTKTRSLPFKEHPQINYLWNKINTKYISEVRFYMTDDEDREVDLNGIDISLAIVMKSLQNGAGIGDMVANVTAKITGKTAKTLATKVMEEGVEKTGEKTGELIGEKIYDKFSSKKKPSETKGKEIVAILNQEDIPKVDKYQYIKDAYNDLL